MTKFLIILISYLTIIIVACQRTDKNQNSENEVKGTLKSMGGDTSTIPTTLKNNNNIIFFGGFDEDFNNEKWKTNWGIDYIEYGVEPTIIETGFNNTHSLRVKYPVGGIGPKETGASYPIVFNSMPNLDNGYYNELYIRYYLKFEEGFDFRLGGKLPGMMGGGDSWTRSGGQQPDGTNGWTLRFMWRKGGKIVVYAYLPVSGNNKYGGETWGQDIQCNYIAEQGKWICLEQFVNVGNPGKDDGKLIVWIDGKERINISDLRFWNIKNNYGKIGGIYFSTFHGGNTKDWAPTTDSYIQFDEIVAATERIGP